MTDNEYETHVRSNESIRDNMDGVMTEPSKTMSQENNTNECNNCSNCNCNEMSRG